MKNLLIYAENVAKKRKFVSQTVKVLSVAMLLLSATLPAWGFESKPKFKAEKTSDSPTGGGKIYAKRGGGDGRSPYDRIDLAISEGDWKNPDSEVTLVSDITLKQGENEPDGYKVMDRTSSDATGSTYILHMYYFAKPNTGYEFVGWYSDAAGSSKINGSTDHYPLPEVSGTSKDVNKYYYTEKVPQPADKKKSTYPAVQWNNGEKGKTPSASGSWNDGEFYYLRDAFEITNATANDGAKIYVKFRVKPRAFELGGTGSDEVSYTASGYGTVGKGSVTANNISGNITLTLTYDSEKYNFNGWYYAEGSFTNGTLLSTNATATYTLVPAKGLTESTRIHIWPDVKRKSNPVAEVTYNSTTTPYESWAEAIAAAKATGVSGATITLFKDVADITTAQEIDRDMTLDLNGHTFSGTANYLFTVKNSGTDFTITNGSVNEGIISFSTDAVTPSYAVGVQTGAKLILEGGKIYANNTKSDGTGRGVEISNGGTLEMTGGTVESQALQNAYAIINRGTATIGGTAELYAHTTSAATAVAFYNVGTSATISGGTFRAYATTTTARGIEQNVNNTLTVTNAIVRAEAVTSTAYALVRSNGTIVVNSGKYNAVAPSTVAAVNVANNTQITLQGGIYRTNTSLSSCCASGYGCYELNRGETWNEGYRYEVLPTSQARNFRVIADGTSSYFTSFADLNTFINASSSPVIQIFLIVPEYTVPAGNYTIPSVAALVIPYDFDCTIKTDDPEHPYDAPGTPSLYRKLVMATGANITVNSGGYISVGGTSQGGQPYGGCVYGKYGQIDMKSGSSITLKTGTNLYCWGYITGQGDITAESGSTVYEDFQIACWRGGTAASSMNNNSKGVFPLAQYFIQNIEAKLHLQSGATEKVWTAVSALSDSQRPDGPITLVGSSSGLFQVSSGALTKWYNAVDDRQMYELSGNMLLSSISMTIYISINSANYVLPITNNMDIRIKSGTMSCNQKIAVLPGAKITIDEGANVSMGASSELYVYDKDEWPNDGASAFNYPSKSFNKVNYTPTSITNPRTYAKMNDAIMDINGTLTTASGHFYTTQGKAEIISSEGTGRIVFSKAAQGNTATYQATQDGTSISYTSIPITAAQLRNEDGTYTATAGAKANDYYQYCGDTWKKGGCVNYYTITWKSEDGNTTLETDADVAEGSTTSFDKADPTKDQTAQYTYIFDGWTTAENGGGDFYAKGATPAATADATYYAHFSSTPQPYTLTWVTDGDDLTGNYTSGTVAYGASITAPNTPTKTGYTFAGWHNGTSVVTPSTMPAEATTYTATWTPIVYNIIYKDKDDEGFSGTFIGAHPTTHTYGTATALVNPTREGYAFRGWFSNMTCTAGNEVTELGAADYTSDVTVYAKWISNTATFTVTWMDMDPLVDEAVVHEDIVEAGGRPKQVYHYDKPNRGGYRFEMQNWVDGIHRYSLTDISEYPEVWANVTYQARYKSILLNLEVSSSKELTQDTVADVTIVHKSGRLNVGANELKTEDLILEATSDESAELVNGGTINVTGNAYFDLTLNTERRHWRAFTVPFEIDLKQHQILADGVSMPLGVQYDIVYYRGDIRAEQGKVPACWHYVEDDANWILTPGVAYLIVFGRDVNTVRFTKKDEASINYTGTVSVAENNGASDDVNGGWNGIGNPATYHALLSAGVTECQVHNGEEIGSDGYIPCDMGKFIVGKAVFVQVAAEQTVVVNKADSDDPVIAPKPQSAPRRAQANATGKNRFDVQIAPADGQMADRMFLLADEDKEDKYVILQDLAKAGLSTKRAQMWVDRYGTKLCKNTAVMSNDQAEYPLGISIPTAGEYQIAIAERPDEESVLYLTFDGKPIWNLTYAPFVANFEKGTTPHYGLLLVRRNVPTGIDPVQAGTQPTAQKILWDGKVYILRGDNVYSVDGQLVK